MADIVPPAIEQLAPDLRARLAIVQQARDEDEKRVARGLCAARREGRGRAVLRRSAGAHRGGASHRLALRRLDGRRACRDRPARRSWCRCRTRSTRTSSPTPTCWRRPAARSCCAQDDFTPERLAGEIAGARRRSGQASRDGGRRQVRRRARCRRSPRRSGVARGECDTGFALNPSLVAMSERFPDIARAGIRP